MITLYRPANYNNPRASEFTGRSADIKPFDVENGAIYHELDTGRTYRFDKENSKWYETEGGLNQLPALQLSLSLLLKTALLLHLMARHIARLP